MCPHFRAYCNDLHSCLWGTEEYNLHPRFVLHVLAQKIFPHIECDDAKIVLSLIYTGTHFHTCFTLVTSL